jgi:hypothetical protein
MTQTIQPKAREEAALKPVDPSAIALFPYVFSLRYRSPVTGNWASVFETVVQDEHANEADKQAAVQMLLRSLGLMSPKGIVREAERRACLGAFFAASGAFFQQGIGSETEAVAARLSAFVQKLFAFAAPFDDAPELTTLKDKHIDDLLALAKTGDGRGRRARGLRTLWGIARLDPVFCARPAVAAKVQTAGLTALLKGPRP